MIVTEESKIKTICEPCSSIEEGEEIAKQLLQHLVEAKDGVGLAANQIGINKRVCIVNVPTGNNTDPIILINPEIVEKSEEMFGFMEGCLSFPGEGVQTRRHKWVKVKADNHESTLFFNVWNENNEDGYNKGERLNYALETACVQHEIDHLDGITMYDRQLKLTPTVRRFEKIGRNEKVTITDGKDTKELKWKKAQPLVESGEWEMAEV